jgi:hypothetical protein
MDAQALRPFAQWVIPPIAPILDTILRFYPQALAAQHFIDKRMAVLSCDTPETRRTAASILIPALERLGGKVLDQRYFPETAQGATSQAGGAVLDFKTKGIDRVAVWQCNGGWYAFTIFAERQGYRPRYGVTSFETPQQYIDQLPAGARMPPSQLHGAVGAGWSPDADVRNYPVTEREKACWNVVKSAGTNYKTRADGYHASWICEQFEALSAALTPMATKALRSGDVPGLFHSLGTRFVPVTIPKSRYAPGKLDSAAVYAHFAYDDTCDCFAYRTPFMDIP